MTLGTLNHLCLIVKSLEQSEPFYDTILGFMGYQQVEKTICTLCGGCRMLEQLKLLLPIQILPTNFTIATPQVSIILHLMPIVENE